jgi:hypothetical protein
MQFRKRPWFQRVAACAAACASLVLGAGMLGAPPAFASSSPVGISPAAGHVCNPTPTDINGYSGVICDEVGIYRPASGGAFVTLQVEGICELGGSVVGCAEVSINGEIANGSGFTQGGTKSCSGDCQSGRNYFFPFGGIAISPGHCANNLWGVALAGSSTHIDFVDGGGFSLGANFGTNHFNVCESSSGAFKFTSA